MLNIDNSIMAVQLLMLAGIMCLPSEEHPDSHEILRGWLEAERSSAELCCFQLEFGKLALQC